MVGKSSNSAGKAPCPQHHLHRVTTTATHTRVPSTGHGVNNNILGRKLAMIGQVGGKSKHSLLSHDFTCPTPNSEGSAGGSGNRHNVAIATQVINPSAIRGSFHRRRLVRPFAAEEDDEEDDEVCFGGRRGSGRFGSRRSRCVNWNKLGCYGISIVVIVLVMTGVVLAVGYMQSEKQKILTRSAKLAQDRNATIMLMNQLIPDTTSTTTLSANLSTVAMDVDESPILQQTTTEITTETENENEKDSESATIQDSEEVQLIEPSHEDHTDADSDPEAVTEHDAEILDNPATVTVKNEESLLISDVLHKTPSEVTILPPKEFSFDGRSAGGGGVSFDIPIYNASGKDETSFTFQVIPPATTAKYPPGEFQLPNGNAANSVVVDDVPIVAKLQTDLFEAGSDSAEDYEQNSPTGSTQTQAQSQSRQKGRSGGSGNPPKVKVPDRSYTPRPSSVHKYKPKPRPTYKPPSIKFQLNDASSAEYSGGNSNSNVAAEGPVSVIVPPPTNFKFDPSPAPAPPYAKFDYSGPVTSVTPATPAAAVSVTPYNPTSFENIKFDFTTQSSAVTLPSTSVDLRFDFNNFATAHGLDLSGVGNGQAHASTSPTTVTPSYVNNQNFEIDYSKLTGSSGVSHNENSNSIDSQQLSPQSAAISSIGSASPVGATLNQFYNFDSPATASASSSNPYLAYINSYGGGNEDAPKLSPGQIPLDLASSYIQAGPPGKIYNTNNGGAGDLSSSFSYNDPSLATFNVNGGNYGGGSSSGGTPAPNYNTITQGIHLLSLLSGNIPNHLLQGHSDQQSAGSNTHSQLPDYNSKPEYQIAGLTGYGGSSNAFLAGINSNSNSGGGGSGAGNYNPYLISDSQSAASGSAADYTADLYSSKKFPDQEGSFSQNIISKIKAGADSSSSRSEKSISTATTPLGSMTMPKLPATVEDHGPTLDVLGLRALLNKFIESGSTSKKEVEKSADEQHKQSKPRKSADLDTAASEAVLLMKASDSPEFGRKLTLKTSSQKKREWEEQVKGHSASQIEVEVGQGQGSSENERSEKGLKSGFYV